MKRHAFALIIHPYKNALLGEDALRPALNRFVEKLVELTTGHQMLRFNLVVPGYLLELIDPILLAKLREIQKADRCEWLTTGYTEPFVSFSPQWLSMENIKRGKETYNDLVGYTPVGYFPPFSNWEPSFIDRLSDCAMQYAVVSRTLFSRKEKNCCGYWITEHSGSTIPIFPCHTFHMINAPTDVSDWLEHTFKSDPIKDSTTRLVTIEYLVLLSATQTQDPFQWLNDLAKVIDSLIVKYQVVRLSEFTTLANPLGMHYIPSSLVYSRGGEDLPADFLNQLHTFDQLSLLQRKMLDAAEAIQAGIGQKKFAPLLRQLFFVQDINRYLPAAASGFAHAHDREWTYAKLIDIENQLLETERSVGSQLRIADFLRNGTKSIILANKALKVYIDHKNGGQIFEFDIRERRVNLCAGYNSRSFPSPRILCAGISRTSFIDLFLDQACTHREFTENNGKQIGDFITGQFQYKVKKDGKGVKAILSRQGSITCGEKTYPLFMEKVFGLGEEGSALSFVYQLSNPSLTSYGFTFAVSLTLSLPGLFKGQTYLMANRVSYKNLQSDSIILEDLTQWALFDSAAGIALHFHVQKPLHVWCFPTLREVGEGSSGTLTLMFSAPVNLQENAVWSLIGKMTFKKIRLKGTSANAL
jgi:hypothetical protein